MIERLLRAVACAGICASLSGCSGSLGQIGAGLAMAAVATVVEVAKESSHEHAHAEAQLAMARAAGDPLPEDLDLGTCEAKRREFRSVYGDFRRMPAQLRCTEDGDFPSTSDPGEPEREPVAVRQSSAGR